MLAAIDTSTAIIVLSVVALIVICTIIKDAYDKDRDKKGEGEVLSSFLRNRIAQLESENSAYVADFTKKLSEEIQQYKVKDVETIGKRIEEAMNMKYLAIFNKWKAENEVSIRANAIKQSRAVTLGKVSEHIVPFKNNFPFNPKDCRFIGSPVDIIVFEGADEGGEVTIYFLEIKTGRSKITDKQARIRDAVVGGRVEWREIKIGADGQIA